MYVQHFVRAVHDEEGAYGTYGGVRKCETNKIQQGSNKGTQKTRKSLQIVE